MENELDSGEGNGFTPLGIAVLFIKRREKGGSEAREKKKILSGQQKEMPNFREKPKSVSTARLPPFSELRVLMNGTFYREAMGCPRGKRLS